MKEKIYMVKETGELLLWTNLLGGKELVFWFFQKSEDSYTLSHSFDESSLEYIGEL